MYQSVPPPVFSAASLSQCYTLLSGAHPRSSTNLLQLLPVELLQQICLVVREPIDHENAYHFSAASAGGGALNLWIIGQRRHERHDHVPSHTRVVLQHVELPDLPDPGAPPHKVIFLPVVTRMLGHYDGFCGRSLLVRWTHRVESAGLELREWPAACTAEELRAPRIPAPSRRISTRGRDDDDSNPLVLTLPRLPHATRMTRTTLDLGQLCFKKLLLARPDVHHTSVVIGGSPSGQTLQEAPDSLGDAEECFTKTTTGARNCAEAQLADEHEARVVQVMAAIEKQREQIRVEEAELQC